MSDPRLTLMEAISRKLKVEAHGRPEDRARSNPGAIYPFVPALPYPAHQIEVLGFGMVARGGFESGCGSAGHGRTLDRQTSACHPAVARL